MELGATEFRELESYQQVLIEYQARYHASQVQIRRAQQRTKACLSVQGYSQDFTNVSEGKYGLRSTVMVCAHL